MRFITLLNVLFITAYIAQGLPDKWWENTKGVHIDNAEQLEQIFSSNPDKFVMLDFYGEWCGWCYFFQEEWNQLVDDFDRDYGD